MSPELGDHDHVIAACKIQSQWRSMSVGGWVGGRVGLESLYPHKLYHYSLFITHYSSFTGSELRQKLVKLAHTPAQVEVSAYIRNLKVNIPDEDFYVDLYMGFTIWIDPQVRCSTA